MPPELRLLGPPRLHGDGADGEPVDLPPTQALLLGAYLVHHGDWVGRDALIGAFWPDEDEKTARHNLSQLLYHCRKQGWSEGIEAERQRVRWPVASDLARFRDALAEGDWRAAVELYGGPFLEGVEPSASGSLEGWLADARQQLHAGWREGALARAQELADEGDVDEAAAVLERILERDVLAEDALQLLLAHARGGRRVAALRRYERFRELLAHELGIEPLDVTVRLAETLGSGEADDAADDVPAGAAVGFPHPVTGFVGRDLELVELGGLLQRGDSRLVTLLGPGGIGKTRLAIRLGLEQAAAFRDGAAFAELAPLGSAELLAPTLLSALGVSGSAERDAREQLLEVASRRRTLLVLDNFEHLLEGATLVAELLAASPGSGVLVTSRAALGVRGEQVYDVQGLSFPERDDGAFESWDAVKLFVRAAQRTDPGFALDADARAHVLRLCRLLRGSALGLELAAAWLRALPLGELVAEIERDLDVLTTDAPDAPERQRSLRAAFEHSWRLLAPEEQRALARLAVFRGGFTRDAARAVAEVSPRTLLALVDRSLLRRTPAGRFERHAAVQRYSEEKLRSDPDAWEAATRAHLEHYVAFAEEAVPRVKGAEQIVWLERLGAEHDNLRAALARAERRGELDTAVKLAGRLWPFWYIRCHYQEGRRWLTGLVTRPGIGDRAALARALGGAAVFTELAGDLAGAEALYRRGLELARELGAKGSEGTNLVGLAIVAMKRSAYAEAEELFAASYDVYRDLGDVNGMAHALGNLSLAARHRGDMERARDHSARGLRLARENGDTRAIAIALNNLGDIQRELSRLDDARDAYRESLELHERLGDQHGLALCHTKLGLNAQDRGDLEGARARFAQAVAITREVGDPWIASSALHNLAGIAWLEGRLDECLALEREALPLFVETGTHRGIPQALERFALLAWTAGDAPRGALLLGAAEGWRARNDAPRNDLDERDLERELAPLRAALEGGALARRYRAGAEAPLDEAVARALELRPSRPATREAPS